MQTKTCPNAGFTLIEIMIVITIIGLLAAMAVPSLKKATDLSQKTACIQNLKAIAAAKSIWALEHRRSMADTPTTADLFGPDKTIQVVPQCPAGGLYELKPVGENPVCNVIGHTL